MDCSKIMASRETPSPSRSDIWEVRKESVYFRGFIKGIWLQRTADVRAAKRYFNEFIRAWLQFSDKNDRAIVVYERTEKEIPLRIIRRKQQTKTDKIQ